jgi:hypothetical protein
MGNILDADRLAIIHNWVSRHQATELGQRSGFVQPRKELTGSLSFARLGSSLRWTDRPTSTVRTPAARR